MTREYRMMLRIVSLHQNDHMKNLKYFPPTNRNHGYRFYLTLLTNGFVL
jgi:hypothetical protein